MREAASLRVVVAILVVRGLRRPKSQLCYEHLVEHTLAPQYEEWIILNDRVTHGVVSEGRYHF